MRDERSGTRQQRENAMRKVAAHALAENAMDHLHDDAAVKNFRHEIEKFVAPSEQKDDVDALMEHAAKVELSYDKPVEAPPPKASHTVSELTDDDPHARNFRLRSEGRQRQPRLSVQP